jgi:hypothetical protein
MQIWIYFSSYFSVDFLCQMNKRVKIKLCSYLIDLDFLVGLWIVTIWTIGFLCNNVEQFRKCFIFCCKFSIAMTKSKLFWCMCVLATQKVGKKNLCMEKRWLEIDQSQVDSTLCFCNFFLFVKLNPCFFAPYLVVFAWLCQHYHLMVRAHW